MLSKTEAKDLVTRSLFPKFKKEREKLNKIDRWMRWEHDTPHKPNTATSEYKELAKRAEAPWGRLIVTSVVQNLYVDGYRLPDRQEDSPQWDWWRRNGMKRRQIAVHRDAVGYGLAYVTTVAGVDPLTGKKQPVSRGVSPRQMLAVYDDPVADDWPQFALQAVPAKVKGSEGWSLRLYDNEFVYFLECDSGGTGVDLKRWREHGAAVCPVVRFCNQLDNEGRAPGEIEPFIPLLGRIDQTIFDRLVVQRFGAWVVRTISGMSKPDGVSDADWETYKARAKMALTVDAILVAEDADTKLGSLPATDLSGFIASGETDLRQLAAVSQTPAHEMLGQMANLSAEALAAARASLTAKCEETRYSFGPSWDQHMRLNSHVMDDTEGADNFAAEVRWRDTEIRSLAQAADALGKLSTMLGVPVELLWEKIPGWTDNDVDRARALVQKGGIEALMQQLVDAQQPPAD